MTRTWVTFEGAHHADGSPVSRTEALAGAWEQLLKASAEDSNISGALLLLDSGERVEIDLAGMGRA